MGPPEQPRSNPPFGRGCFAPHPSATVPHMPRGPGQPTKLTQVVRIRPDGTELTAGDQVIERIQLGLDLQSAADSAGISRQTLHNWRLAGARHRAAQAQGNLPNPTEDQDALIAFLDALERAESEAEGNRLLLITKAAQGGATVQKTTVKTDGTGREVERTVVTETLRPEWTAAAWWLERRMPRKYARRVEVTGADGAPLVAEEDRAAGLADSLRLFLEGAAAAQELDRADD